MNTSWQDFLNSLALNTTPQPLLAAALYPQNAHGFIEISGIDAGKFLQGQLSCDIQKITLQMSGLGSHSNAKGRMQSSFRIMRKDDNTFLLRVHNNILEKARAALAKYIVFSKATIGINDSYAGIGLHGPQAREALRAFFTDVPDSDYAQHIENGSIIICTSAALGSYEIYTTAEQGIGLWQGLGHHLPACDSSQHQLLENRLGLAFVEAGTHDAFIPQMFNYQCTPAISFTKGCYTGQEIVARMHYLGKVKRHMRHFTADCTAEIKAGDAIYSSGKEQSIGDIVSCVKTGNVGWDLLINLTDEAASAGQLQLPGAALEHLQEIALPYPLTE